MTEANDLYGAEVKSEPGRIRGTRYGSHWNATKRKTTHGSTRRLALARSLLVSFHFICNFRHVHEGRSLAGSSFVPCDTLRHKDARCRAGPRTPHGAAPRRIRCEHSFTRVTITYATQEPHKANNCCYSRRPFFFCYV